MMLMNKKLTDEKKQEIIVRLTRWLVFSILFALFPFFFNMIDGILIGSDVSTTSLFGNGQLFLISTTLCAVAVGELLGVSSTKSTIFGNIAATFASGFAILIILLASYCYASIGKNNIKLEMMMLLSFLFF